MSPENDAAPDLPPFVWPPEPSKPSPGDMGRANLEKARAAMKLRADNRKRATQQKLTAMEHAQKVAAEAMDSGLPSTVEEAIEVFREQIVPLGPLVVKIFAEDMLSDQRAVRAQAAKDWREMVLGRPRQSDEKDERPTTIVIQSEVFGEIAAAKEKHGR